MKVSRARAIVPAISMTSRRIAVATLLVAACSRSGDSEKPGGTTAAPPRVAPTASAPSSPGTQAPNSGSMAAMPRIVPHENIDSVTQSAVADSSRMSGMSRMPGMAMGSPATPPSARRDQGRSGTPASAMTGMAGMDHMGMSTPARQDRTRTGQPPSRGTGGMTMSMPMSGQVPDDAATRKLLAITSALLDDPVVQRQIEADPVLRAAWADSAVRRMVQQPR